MRRFAAGFFLALSGCSSVGGSGTPDSIPLSNDATKIFDVQSLPIGTRIFTSNEEAIEDSGLQVVIDPSSAIIREKTSTYVRTPGKVYTLSPAARIIPTTEARRYFVLPGQIVPEKLVGQRYMQVVDSASGHVAKDVANGGGAVREIVPCHCGSGNTNDGPPDDYYPSDYSETSDNGIIQGMTATNTDVEFAFTNVYGTASYNWTLEFYDSNGTPIGSQSGSGQITGVNGAVDYDTSSWTGTPYWSVQLSLTVTSGNSASPGNAHVKGSK